MSKRKIVQLTSFLLAVVMCLYSLTFSSLAAERASDSTGLVTVEECYLAGEKWITANYDDETTIESVIPIKSLNEEINGYCINFSKKGMPNGYLVIEADRASTCFIREFTLSGPGLYEHLTTKASLKTKLTQPAIYSTSPFEYAVKFNDNGVEKYYNTNGEILTSSEQKKCFPTENIYKTSSDPSKMSTRGNGTYHDAFFDGSSLTAYSFANNHIIPAATTYLPYRMEDFAYNAEANCGPTAVTNILGLTANSGWPSILINNDMQDTYDQVVIDTYFNTNTSDGTLYVNLKTGIRTYVENRGFQIAITSFSSNTWANFKNCADNNYPNLINIWGDSNNGLLETLFGAGHFVVGIGYRIMNDGTKYLRVIDGWTESTDRFLSFNSSYIDWIKGTEIYIHRY